jgi:hypothetical protein
MIPWLATSERGWNLGLSYRWYVCVVGSALSESPEVFFIFSSFLSSETCRELPGKRYLFVERVQQQLAMSKGFFTIIRKPIGSDREAMRGILLGKREHKSA